MKLKDWLADKKRGTIVEMATAVDCTPAYIGYLANGQKTNPRLWLRKRIAQFTEGAVDAEKDWKNGMG